MRPLPSLSGFQSALIVKPSSLGDIVHTLPAVQAIRSAYPQLRLRWLANTEWTPLLEGAPVVDEVIAFPRKQFRGLKGLRDYVEWTRAWRQLPREAPEIVLDFQGLLRSAIVARARGSRPIVGLSDSREGARWLHDHIIPVRATDHAVERYLALPRAFGITIGDDEVHFPLAQGTEPRGWVDPGPFIVVHPWSRGQGKSLDADTLAALCQSLAPHPVCLVGMRSGASVPLGAHIHDWSDRTSLAELLYLLRQAHWVISVDSGPMHIAAAVNDRTLGIHTWSDPRHVGPYNRLAWVWKAGRIGHRSSFSQDECQTTQAVTPADVGEIAAFIAQRGEKD